MTWIKICGTTSERDADISIRAGANALGFIMMASPRQVTDTTAYSIGTIVPKGVETIGVFMNETLETLIQTAGFCKFTGVQLHGEEDAEYLQNVRARLPGVKVLKAVTVEKLKSGITLKPDTWLIDSAAGTRGGGTGRVFNWADADPVLKKLREPVIIAGGLNPQNVGQALEIFRPWGVDVASGVESYPGRKHPGALTQFIDAVREFDAQSHNPRVAAQKGQRT